MRNDNENIFRNVNSILSNWFKYSMYAYCSHMLKHQIMADEDDSGTHMDSKIKGTSIKRNQSKTI